MANATGGFESSRYTFMRDLLNQVKGASAIESINVGNQITNMVPRASVIYDPLVTRMSALVGRTLMAIRPYEDRLKGIEVTKEAFGWITRKENFVDSDPEQNKTFTLTDGQSIDPWIVRKPKVIETASYGGGQITRFKTIYEDQIKGALASPAELDSFISSVLMQFNNEIAQDREQYKRTALLNLMGSIYGADDSNRCIHMVSLYNDITGSELDSQTAFAPANFEAFTQWSYGFIQKLIGLMSERSYIYHVNPTAATPISGNIARQTALKDMRVFLNTGFKADMAARVVANTFNRDELKEVQYESVNYWQNINSPTNVNVTAKAITSDLTETTFIAQMSNVFGLIMDRDALTVSFMNDNTGNSPYNQMGRYYNIIHNEDVQIRQDLTENAVLLLLD